MYMIYQNGLLMRLQISSYVENKEGKLYSFDKIHNNALHEKPRIPIRIRLNMACNITRIPK